MHKSYNQQLVEGRVERGLSLKEAAKEIGISRITLFFYERGYYRPSKKNLEKINNFYGHININEANEYPQESLIKINIKPRSKKLRFIISGAIAALSIGLIITSVNLFSKSATNVESYYGPVYNEVYHTAIEKGQTGRDIVTDLEYVSLFNGSFDGRSDVIFYKTNSILYFNNSSYTVSDTLEDMQELGRGRFRYQFGGSLGKSSYICTFSYTNSEAGMFFSTDVFYEKKPIEKITNLNVLVEGNVPITEELAVHLFNAKIEHAMYFLSGLLTQSLEKDVDFYDEFLRDREVGRVVNFRMQITSLILFFVSLFTLIISLALFVYSLIGLIINKKEEQKVVDGDQNLPKDMNINFGIPDFILNWLLKVISFASLVILLLGSFGGMFLKLPPIFSNETFMNAFKICFAGGIFIRQIILLASVKKQKTLLQEIAKYAFFYVTMASIETSLMAIAETWGYNLSDLLYSFIPRGVLLAACLNYIIFYFLFFSPSFIQKRGKGFTVLWRLLSLIPLGTLVAITLVGNGYELFYGVKKNIYVIFWFSNLNLALSFAVVLFIYALFFIRLFFKHRYGKENASIYFGGHKFNLIVNITVTAIITIIALIDLLFKGNTVGHYIGLGNNIWVLVFIPLVLFSKRGPNESKLFAKAEETNSEVPLVTE